MQKGRKNDVLTEGKVPPHDIKAERVVLGALLLDKQAFAKISTMLKPECFYKEQNGLVYQACMNLFAKNVPIDTVTVVHELRGMKQLENAGGAYAISTMTNEVASSANIHAHAMIINQCYMRREMTRLGMVMAQESYDESADIFDQMAKAERLLREVNFIHTSSKLGAQDRADEALADLRAKMDGKKNVLHWGNESWDAFFGPLEPSLIILGARPGMGKTALAIWLSHMIAHQGVHVPFFSLEMEAKKLSVRELSMYTMIPYTRILKGEGYISEDEYDRLQTVRDRLKNNRVLIDDSPHLTIQGLAAKCHKLKQQHRLGAVVVDYLQLLDLPQKYSSDNRNNAVQEATRSLKLLSRELELPVIMLSQLNRETEKRGASSKRPQLSDLRDSGGIEQDADTVIFPMRWEYYGEGEDDKGYPYAGRTEMIVAKNRNGKVGSFWMKSDIATNNYWRDDFRPYTKLDDFDGMVPPEEIPPY